MVLAAVAGDGTAGSGDADGATVDGAGLWIVATPGAGTVAADFSVGVSTGACGGSGAEAVTGGGAACGGAGVKVSVAGGAEG